MKRQSSLWLAIALFLLFGCVPSEETDLLNTSVNENLSTPLPEPSQTTPIVQTAEPTSAPTELPTAVPTEAPIIVSPTNTPSSVTQLEIEGDCASLKRPITYTTIGTSHEFLGLVDNGRCTLRFPEDQQFTFSRTMTIDGIYGSIFETGQLKLVRVNFDGTISDLNITVGGFFVGYVYASANHAQIVWSDGDGNPDNPDEFIAKLWVANSDGSDPRVIYEHATDLTTTYNEILIPIGFLPNGNVLFSIEPAGRGGGWVYTGEHSNLYQTAVDSTEKQASDRIFTCPTETPFCVGDFTDNFSHFASTDSEKQTMYIVQLDTRSEVWRTTVSHRTFIGRPQFSSNRDLAFVAVDVVDNGNALRPENGYIGLVNFPYDGEVEQVTAEFASDIVTWVGNETVLYYELTSNVNGEWRYPLITRDGVEVGVWESNGRFPSVIK